MKPGSKHVRPGPKVLRYREPTTMWWAVEGQLPVLCRKGVARHGHLAT